MKKSSSLFLNAVVASFSLLVSLAAFADNATAPAVPGGAAPAAGAPQAPSMFSMVIPFAGMFAIFYFLSIRPQQKKIREQQELLNNLKAGDEVLTASGILGKITGITDKVVTLEIDNNVRIKMMKSQVAQVVKGSIKDLT